MWQRIASDMRIKGVNTSKWGCESFQDAIDCCANHFKKHGSEVGAETVEQYIRKAEAFAQNLKGAKITSVPGYTANVKRYRKNGKYIDLDEFKNIISFGI